MTPRVEAGVSEKAVYLRGWPLAPGGDAYLQVVGLDRQQAELLLASWFVWLGDRAVITLAPTGEALAAELRIRRWKTRPGVVLFRWRNADATRASFASVRACFEGERREFELELTPKTKKPRAMVIPLAPEDVFSPAAAVGLAMRAFAAAGRPDTDRYDVTCQGAVLEVPTLPRRLILRAGPLHAVQSLGHFAIAVVRWSWRRMLRWARGSE